MENGNAKPKFEGVVVYMNGTDWVMPSLSVKQAKDLWPTVLIMDQGVTSANLPEKHEEMLKVIHAALTRNYPDVKIEDLRDWIDLGSIRKVLLIIMGQSGLKPIPGAEPAAAPNATSTGPVSMVQ